MELEAALKIGREFSVKSKGNLFTVTSYVDS